MAARLTGLHRVLPAAVLVTAAVFAAQASAQQRLSLSERVERLEQQASNGQSGVELVNQIQALQSQVQVLQGQVEELRHQLGQAQQRAKDQYIDLDSRIGRLEGAPAAVASPGPEAASASAPALEDIQLGASSTPAAADTLTAEDAQLAPANPSEISAGTVSAPPAAGSSEDVQSEQAAYDEAFGALKDGRYAESARRFQAFIDRYPNAALIANAYYWLGESYYATQNYPVALNTFAALLDRFPQSQKAADGLLKKGYCLYELKRWDEAEATLKSVVDTYSDSTVARLAQGRLRALQLENRR